MAKDGVKTKPKKLDSKGHKHQKHEKGRKTDLKEQVLSMGGKESDLALLEGVEGDMEIVTGEQGTDVSNLIHSMSLAEHLGSPPLSKMSLHF